MKLKRARITYQRHVDLELELVDGLNVIVGPTDSGKSSIIRAIRWVMENKPAGSQMISPSGSARVELELVDGRTLVRERSGKVNSYEVCGEVFTNFGRDVPPVVRAVADEWGRFDVVLQRQTEDAYFVGWDEPTRARVLDEVSGAGVASVGAAELKLEASRLEREQKEAQARVAELEAKLSSSEVGLDDLAREVEEGLRLAKEVEGARRELEKLELQADLVDQVNDAVRKLESDLCGEVEVGEAEDLLEMELGLRRVSSQEKVVAASLLEERDLSLRIKATDEELAGAVEALRREVGEERCRTCGQVMTEECLDFLLGQGSISA